MVVCPERNATNIPNSHDCVQCKFAGKQKYGTDDTCFFTGGRCKKEEQREPAKKALSPEAKGALELWHAVQSQWRMGFSGPTGLDYAAVKATAEVLEINFDANMFSLIQAMEGAMLRDWAAQSEEKAKSKASK